MVIAAARALSWLVLLVAAVGALYNLDLAVPEVLMTYPALWLFGSNAVLTLLALRRNGLMLWWGAFGFNAALLLSLALFFLFFGYSFAFDKAHINALVFLMAAMFGIYALNLAALWTSRRKRAEVSASP